MDPRSTNHLHKVINELRKFFEKIYHGNTMQAEQMVNHLVARATAPNTMIGWMNFKGLDEKQAKFVRRQMQFIKLLTPKREHIETPLEKEIKLLSSIRFFKEKKTPLSKFEMAVNDLYQCIYINKECWGKEVDENKILRTLLDIALAPDVKVSSIDKMVFPPKLESAFVDFIKKQLIIIAENPPQAAVPLNQIESPKKSVKK